MCLCSTIIIKGILGNCYSMIHRQNKIKVCKLNLQYLTNLSKFYSIFSISDTYLRQQNRKFKKNIAIAAVTYGL